MILSQKIFSCPSPPLIQPLTTFNSLVYFLSAALSLSLQFKRPSTTRNALKRQINAVSLQGNIENKKRTDKILSHLLYHIMTNKKQVIKWFLLLSPFEGLQASCAVGGYSGSPNRVKRRQM